MFKKGDKGIIVYKSTFLCETDIKIVPLYDITKWSENVMITSEDDRLYSVLDGSKVLLYNNVLTDKTLLVERLPVAITEFGQSITLTTICYKIDNDVIKLVKDDNDNSSYSKEEKSASAMRERANRLAGIYN